MLVIDASIAAKWIFKEDDSDRALALLAEGHEFGAPSLIIPELGSIAWKRVRRGLWGAEDAARGVRVAANMLTTLAPVEQLWEQALQIALRLDHPIYDCFYMAMAQREGASIASADQRMSAKARSLGLEVKTW